jgi:hypothetical protein
MPATSRDLRFLRRMFAMMAAGFALLLVGIVLDAWDRATA